jgi:cysteine desulfuration protein SufE
MTINEIQDQIIDDFSVYEEWMDKYQYLIDLSKELPMIDEKEKTEQNIIKGCQSRVWLSSKLTEGIINFTADSDAIITKGIIALLVKVMDGRSPKEILDTELYFIDKIGLHQHLSPTRSNGLVAMIKQIKMYALAYSQL